MKFFKEILSFIILILINLASFGQKISVPELTKLYGLDWNYFDTFVTTKGYEYSSSKEDEKFSSKSYSYHEIYADTMASRFITKWVDKVNSQYLVTWQTSLKTEYLWFKNQIASNKFKFVESGQFKNSTFFKYKKNSLVLKLYVSKSGKRDAGGNKPVYEISLSNRE